MTKKIILLIVLLFIIAVCFAANSDPYDGTTWDITAPDIDQPIGNNYKEIYDLRKGIAIRMNKEHETLATSSAGGVHKQGSARAFFQDAAPATQVNGDAFDSGDLGSLWFDSDSTPDNQFNVLTATTPTWTPISTEIIAVLLASNRQFAGTLTVDGATTLTGVVGANTITLVAGADLIGSATSDITFNTDKFTVDGATGNTVVAGTLDVTGNIDPTSYETTNGGFFDEDDMASDSATAVASQQSIKKYVDDQWTPTSYAGDESVTIGNGLIIKTGKVSITGDVIVGYRTSAVTFGAAFPTDIKNIQVTVHDNDTDDLSILAGVKSVSTSGFTITYKEYSAVTQDMVGIYWIAMGY